MTLLPGKKQVLGENPGEGGLQGSLRAARGWDAHLPGPPTPGLSTRPITHHPESAQASHQPLLVCGGCPPLPKRVLRDQTVSPSEDAEALTPT